MLHATYTAPAEMLAAAPLAPLESGLQPLAAVAPEPITVSAAGPTAWSEHTALLSAPEPQWLVTAAEPAGGETLTLGSAMAGALLLALGSALLLRRVGLAHAR